MPGLVDALCDHRLRRHVEGRFGGAGGFGVDSVGEVPGEFVARLGPDGLAAAEA